MPVDVSLTWNVRTRQAASPREHPLRAMPDAGLPVTLNSDDPPAFGAASLSRAHLAGLAADAVRASFPGAEAKKPVLAGIAAVASA